MKPIRSIAYYEMRQLLQQRGVLVMLFVLPLTIIFILGSALSAYIDTTPTEVGTVRVALLMEDNGFIRQSLQAYLSGGEPMLAEVTEAGTREELQLLVRSGQTDMGLAVPKGFSEALERGLKPEWEFTSGSDFRKSVTGLQSVYAFFDGWNSRFAEGQGWDTGIPPHESPDRQQWKTFSAAGEAVPPGTDADKAGYSAFQYYGAHVLVMFMLYSGMSSAISLIAAKEDNTLMRLRSLPVPGWKLLLGKVAGQGAVVLLQALFIITGTALLFGISWGGRPAVLAGVCVLATVFTMGLAVIAGVLIRSKNTVMILFQSIIILMTFFSGGYTPSIGETLSKFGVYTLNYWAVQSMLHMMTGADLPVILHGLLVLACIAAGSVLAAAAVYGKAGYHE